MPGMTWDGEANSQLLLSILAVHEVKVDFDAVSALMGPNCTSRAVQEQLKKLKKMATQKASGAAPKAPATKPAKAANVPTTKASGKATKGNGKATKASAPKKTRAAKVKLLRTDSPEPETDKATNEGDLSADDEATSSTNGEAKGNINAAANHKLAKSILSAKRKAEEMDTESDGNVAVKKEKVKSEDEGENGEDEDAQEEDAKRDGGPPNQQMMWDELTYGMHTDGMESI